MSFSICFTGEPDQHLGDDPNVPYALGRIVAGALDEGFASILYEWNKRDYEAQWMRSLRRLIAGDKKVVLITHYVNPTESSNQNGEEHSYVGLGEAEVLVFCSNIFY